MSTEFREKLKSLNFGSVHHSDGPREIPQSQVREVREPSWEKGLVGEKRAGGTFMPILVPGTTRPMRVHERATHSAAIEESKRRRASGYPVT